MYGRLEASFYTSTLKYKSSLYARLEHNLLA